ncbi:starch synthase [Flavobacteriaceae bacterium UJ101]|nr:starch synthase [Flavobacteriaceae bacterium UJ101]
MDKKKILYVTSELTPYFAENNLSTSSLEAAKRMQESGHDVRVFMPRFGVINERRHQLHEVIRLSGMNIVVNDIDQPLIIKVASVPGAKLQAYFIDNEEYFKRKAVYGNEEDPFFKDNDERLIFFARGVLETVKKLNWSPDIIHIQGWFGALLPLYAKTIYKNEPIFSNSKIVYSLYDQEFSGSLNHDISNKIKFDGIDSDIIKTLNEPTFQNLNKIGVDFSDGIVEGSEELSEELKSLNHPIKLDFKPIEETKDAFLAFYSKHILEEKEV